MKKALSIAVLRRNGFGDLICTIPLLKMCRQQYPEASLTLFLEERNAPLAPYLPLDCQIAVIRKGNKYMQTIKSALQSRRAHFDIAIAARPEPMRLNNCFLFALRALKKIAVVDSGDWTSSWINSPLQTKQLCGDHQALKLLQMLDPSLQVLEDAHSPRLFLPPERLQSHAPLLNALLPKKAGPIVFVSTSNNRPCGQLSPDALAELLNALHKSLPFQTALSCLPKDRPSCLALQQKLAMPSHIIETKDFDSFMALLHHVDFLFTGSGGIMHIAAALDKTQVVLFGATEVQKWRPLSREAVCLFHHQDVGRIPKDQILSALKAQLQALPKK